MRYLILCGFIIFPQFLLGQSIDSLKLKINNLEKESKLLKTKIDSLEVKKRVLNKKVLELRQLLNKQELKEEMESGVITKVSAFGGELKDKPSFSGNVIYKLKEGDQIRIFKWFKYPYFKASYNGSVGYISYAGLEENKYIKNIVAESKQKKLKNLKENNPNLFRLKKKYGESPAKRILRGEIWIGMTDKMAREALGSPNHINRSTGSWGIHEQWIYSNNKYLYFENGKLTSWQE